MASLDYENEVIATAGTVYAYDAYHPRVSQITHGGSEVTVFGYSAVPSTPTLGAGQLASVDGPLPNDTITYGYDALGRQTSVAIDGSARTAAFDALGRVSSETNALGTFTYGYAGETGRMLSVEGSHGHRTEFGYKPVAEDQRLASIVNKAPGGAQLSKFEYGYDDNGLITEWLQQAGTSDPAAQWSYKYDAAGQLLDAFKEVSGNRVKSYHYRYDGLGNRLSEQVDNRITSGSFNELNQLVSQQPTGPVRVLGSVNEPVGYVSATSGSNSAAMDVDADGNVSGYATIANQPGTTESLQLEAVDYSTNGDFLTRQVMTEGGVKREFTYDDNGNTTSIMTWSQDGLTTELMTLEWDGADRLVAVVKGNKRSEFTYDYRGLRTRLVEKENGDVVKDVRHLWLGIQLAEERDSASPDVAAKEFFSQGEVRDTTQRYYYTRDHLGSVREVMGHENTLEARYEYDPFGRKTQVAGDFVSEFAFTGHYYHEPSDFHLAPFRAYWAEIGRWMSRDRLDERRLSNRYLYCRNNPTNLVDENGLQEMDPMFWWKRPMGCSTSRRACDSQCVETVDMETCYAWCEAAEAACLAGGCDVGFEHGNPHMVGKEPKDFFYDCDCEGSEKGKRFGFDEEDCKECRKSVRDAKGDSVDPCCD